MVTRERDDIRSHSHLSRKRAAVKKKNLSSQGFENDGAKFKKDAATPVAVLLHTFTNTRLIP